MHHRVLSTVVPPILFGAALLMPVLFSAPAHASPGDITTFAGGPGRGSALAVAIAPSGLTVFGDTLYISDDLFQVIRRVDLTTGDQEIVAGNGATGLNIPDGSGDGGPATAADLSYPGSVAFDAAGNLFIADGGNARVRRVDATTGTITTVADTGTFGFSGDGGPALAAELDAPGGLGFDSCGNLFIGDGCTTDQCNAVGGCVHPFNSLPCDDGDACTQTDTCQSGACSGANPVVCTATDQCRDVGICNPGTGTCSHPALPDGTACDDANVCTQSDTCQAGVCQGANFSWSGVLQPVNGDGSSIFKLGQTVPIKFRLTGACAGTPNVVAKIFLTKISNQVVGSEMEATSTSAADTGKTFRYDAAANQYIYNLATKALSAGTWQLRLDLGDGVPNRTILASLRK
jgi:hypothetical protein